jgi:protein SCO1/2
VRRSRLRHAALVAALTIGTPAGILAQGRPTVDPALASTGKKLFGSRGCSGCHVLGKRSAGPDLLGVNERRDHDWLRRWLKTTDEMLASDSLAQAMLAEFKNVKMPNMKLSDEDIEALLNYIEQETQKKKK